VTTPVPAVPPGLPSSLLERRPDIAGAERELAAANAKIGEAEAAYFPALSLNGQAGYLSNEAGNLFSVDSRVWSVTPALGLPLFNAGRTSSGIEQAKASYQKALAGYRQTVLTAFKDVEDSLVQIKLRNEQAASQAEALASAGRVAELARARYDAGAASYLDVADAEQNMLPYQRLQVQLENQRLAAAVRLIKALGGGWE
jgi:multidrug efflux system outer membrane protein